MAADAGRTAPGAAGLVIGGIEPFSTVDWPGYLALTAFLQGCPWRCTYCHNPGLQAPRVPAAVPWAAVEALLEARRGQLDAVVFSGGEPTRQAALLPAMERARSIGYQIGLHTAGAFPVRLARVLPVVDWVGLDIKATAHQYGAITGVAASGERAFESLDLVQAAGVDYEVRITVDPTVHSRDGVLDLVDHLRARGVREPVLQQARPTGTNPEYAVALGSRGLYDVLEPGDLADVAVR